MDSRMIIDLPDGLSGTALAALNETADSYEQSPHTYWPDGLDESAIEALIEASDSLADQAVPTSALMNGAAARRRERRVTRRRIRLVQLFPIRMATPNPDGWAA